jgi:AcrR family transcriptional regulator
MLDSAPHSHPSLRSVAQAAGVSPALLHYHFGDLNGLRESLLRERALPLLEPLLRELQQTRPDAGAALTLFLQNWTALALRHPWLVACLLEAPASAAQPPLDFVGALGITVEAAQQQGAVRRDLSAGYIALLLLSLGAMPHLSRTALGSAAHQGAMADPGQAIPLTLQHVSVMQSGIAQARGDALAG